MKNKGGTSAVYDEDARRFGLFGLFTCRDFILGFHNRKQAKKVEYLTKKALREKKERALEKIAVRTIMTNLVETSQSPPKRKGIRIIR